MVVTLGIIVGSTRPNRIGRKIADQIHEHLKTKAEMKSEIIDLLDWNLPMYNEPGMPANGEYANSKTLEWSEKIKGTSALMFVTPQYNWGYPASLKNAIDYLYKEWNDKPAIIVSYGGRGGGKAAEQLQQVLFGVRMKPVEYMPSFTLKGPDMKDPTTVVSKQMDDIDKAVKDMLDIMSSSGTS